MLGQVGIRCRHCAKLPTWSRARGAVYYTATLDGLYQAAQNMAKNHLCKQCQLIPENDRARLNQLRDCKKRAAGGKKYWAEGARVLGVRQHYGPPSSAPSQEGSDGPGCDASASNASASDSQSAAAGSDPGRMEASGLRFEKSTVTVTSDTAGEGAVAPSNDDVTAKVKVQPKGDKKKS